MIQAIKDNITTIVVGIVLALGLISALGVNVSAQVNPNPNTTGSQTDNLSKNARCGTDIQLNPQGTCTIGGANTLETVIRNVINVFSLIVGVIAVIMIIVGGIRYVTSGGDSNNVGAAKNTILYAIVGLIIVALAQAIVQFVLKGALGGTQ